MPEDTGGAQEQHPALIIGLGGTGKQVLLNLRRMYYERYGSKHPPYVGHLWVDTDPRNLLLDGKEMDFLMKEVDFDEGEKVDVELNKADLQNFYEHSNDYPHIFSWFDRRLEKFGHIINGAGGIRSFGRLAFFRYYSDIMSSVLERHRKISNVTTHNESLNDQNITLDGNALDVWLIFSVAGGTGSGMFLDFAFALRKRWPNVHIRSIIVLPSVFSNNQKARIYGNAYAALMELEHYGYSRNDANDAGIQEDLHRFPLAWTKEMYEQSGTLQGPVFDSTYLIDNAPASNAGNLALEDKNALCRMIAEWLYIEYGGGSDVSGLAAERRMIEVNFGTVLNRVYPYTYNHNGLEFKEVFSCRYSGFGLSKLYIPVDRVETAVQHRLVKDFLDFWTVDRPIPANLDELLENDYLHRVGINNSNSQRDFIRALDTGGTGDRLTQRLETLVSEKRRRFINMANSPQVSQKINSWLKESLLQGQLDRSDVVQEHWGSITKSIAQNSDKHYEEVIKQLQSLITRLLSEPKHRFEVAREVLRRMRDRLIADAERFKVMEEKNRAASGKAAKKVLQRLQWRDEVNGNFTRRTVIEVALEEIEQQVKRELQAQIVGAAAELANKVANYIGGGVKDKNAQGEEITIETGLIKKVMDYRNDLKTQLLGRLKERIRAFDKIELSPIYQEMSDGVKEIDRFYVDSTNQAIGENTLTKWERQFFEKQGIEGPKDLWDMRNTLKNGENKLIERLLDFANESMSHLKEKTLDTIERLTDRYKPDSAQYHAVVERLLSYAEPWLPKPTHFVDREKVLEKREHVHWLARSPRSGSEAHESFENEVRRLNQAYKLLDTTADRIYAASEVAGFPLMVIPNLDRYRNDSYYPLLESGEVLHTDLAFEKFQDLLIKRPEEVESYIETLKIFLQATLLGIIKADRSGTDESGALMKYRYIDESQLFPETLELGPFSVAIARLTRARERDLRGRIQSSVVDAITDMDVHTLRKWCALLSFHAGGGEQASYYARFPQNHVVRAIFKQEAISLINQNGDNMKTAAKTKMENLNTFASQRAGGQSWAVEKPDGSGLYVLESWRQ